MQILLTKVDGSDTHRMRGHCGDRRYGEMLSNRTHVMAVELVASLQPGHFAKYISQQTLLTIDPSRSAGPISEPRYGRFGCFHDHASRLKPQKTSRTMQFRQKIVQVNIKVDE